MQQSKGPVWFSDESRFMWQKRDGRTRDYRRRNERIARNCVLQVDNFVGGSVMVWGAISYARKIRLVCIPGNLNAARYRDEVLTPHMLPAMNLRMEDFQHCWLSSQPERKSAPWPSKSPDLNLIEHLWDYLGRRVRSRQTLQELQQALEQEWGRIPQDRIRWSIESMPRRVRAVLQANGGHNRYWLWSDVVWTLWTLMW